MILLDKFASQSSAHSALDNLQASMDLMNDSGTQPAILGTDQTPSYTSLGIIEDMFNGPTELDWVRFSYVLAAFDANSKSLKRLYDSRISGVEMATNNNVWYSDAPADPYEFIAYDSLGPPMENQNHHPSSSLD